MDWWIIFLDAAKVGQVGHVHIVVPSIMSIPAVDNSIRSASALLSDNVAVTPQPIFLDIVDAVSSVTTPGLQTPKIMQAYAVTLLKYCAQGADPNVLAAWLRVLGRLIEESDPVRPSMQK